MLKMYQEESKLHQNTFIHQDDERDSPFAFAGNKLYFVSLGCPRNLVDTEVMLGLLLKEGYEPAETLEESDFIIINTCGFLDESRRESLDTIGHCLEQRKEGAKVIVTGCMVQSHSKIIEEHYSTIDFLLGSGDVEKILEAVRSTEKGASITTAKSYLEAGEVPRQLSTPSHYAYLKIAEGCRKRCSYCIIPDIKGPLKSKSIERVLREFRVLRDQGVKEIILIAQDLGDWGKDLGYRNSTGLVQLLREILKEEGDFWLRLLYLYPDEITDELIALMQQDDRICPYLDMPIQHINNTLLKSMRRATSREHILETIHKLKEKIPDIVIRTSLIVGFPGETEDQFKELCSFVSEGLIDNIGVFQYSREPGSHADSLTGHLSESVKEKRYHKLMKIQQKVVSKGLRRLIGKQFKVIVEGYHQETDLLMRARFSGQCPEIDGSIIINDGRIVDAFGEWYMAEVTDVAGYDLVAKITKKL